MKESYLTAAFVVAPAFIVIGATGVGYLLWRNVPIRIVAVALAGVLLIFMLIIQFLFNQSLVWSDVLDAVVRAGVACLGILFGFWLFSPIWRDRGLRW